MKLALWVTVLAVLAAACRPAEDAAPGQDASAPTEVATSASAAADDATTPASPPATTAASGDIRFDVGVTEEACPDAVNPDNGCIYLGTISDLTVGPFAAQAVPLTTAQAAFWDRVNRDGGIGGFDIDTARYTRDNQYTPEVHSQQYEELKDDVLALAQTLGSPTTAAILDDLAAEGIVAAPASWTSAWLFSDVILESGISYCLEAMNAVDYAVDNLGGVETVMAIHVPGDYGEDAAAGARIAADANGLAFDDVETTFGADNQAGAISELAAANPDVVVIATGPNEVGTILGEASTQGFDGTMIASGPAWNGGLLDTAAGPALQEQLLISGPWQAYEADTPGHVAMREALGDVEANAAFTSGWVWSYPLKAALTAAAADGDLTRAGLLAAATSLESVDYEGMLPDGAGNFAGDPDDAAVRQSVLFAPDPETPSGERLIQDFFTGPTAQDYELNEPCFAIE